MQSFLDVFKQWCGNAIYGHDSIYSLNQGDINGEKMCYNVCRYLDSYADTSTDHMELCDCTLFSALFSHTMCICLNEQIKRQTMILLQADGSCNSTGLLV